MNYSPRKKKDLGVKCLFPLTIIFLITISHFACSQPRATNNESLFNRGVLWSIVNPRSQDTSYLMGTIHTMDTNLIKLPLDQLQKLALETDMLCLESVRPASNEVNTKKESLKHALDLFLLKDTSKNIVNSLDGKSMVKLLEILESLKGELRMFKVMLPRIDPSMLTLMLTMKKQTNSPFYKEANFSPERHFEKFAEENNMQIAGLEEYGEALASIKGNDQNFSASMEALKETIEDFDNDNSIDIFKDYLSQNLDLVPKSVIEDSSFIQRNTTMAFSIDSLSQNNSLFIMIGAAHLNDEHGVLNQLRKMGYVINNVEIELTGRQHDHAVN